MIVRPNKCDFPGIRNPSESEWKLGNCVLCYEDWEKVKEDNFNMLDNTTTFIGK